MKAKIGIAPISWSNDDMPELGGDTPIEACLEEAKKAGYAGIELGGKFPRNPGITNFLLNKFELGMPGGWYGAQLRNRSINEEWSAMQDHLNLLRSISNNPKISQRRLASKMGFSLGKLNYCLKALQDKGSVKINNFRKNPNKLNYAYILTRKGILEKSKLTLNFMKRKMKEYDELKFEIETESE